MNIFNQHDRKEFEEGYESLVKEIDNTFNFLLNKEHIKLKALPYFEIKIRIHILYRLHSSAVRTKKEHKLISFYRVLLELYKEELGLRHLLKFCQTDNPFWVTQAKFINFEI